MRSMSSSRDLLSRFFRYISAFSLLFAAAFVQGCTWLGGSAGSLRTASLGDESVVLFGNFKYVYSSQDQYGDTSFMLSNVPVEDVVSGKVTNAQLLHVQLLWLPKAGSTPMDATATNACVRYVVLSNGEIGLYSGAGFALPDSDLDAKRITVTLYDASLQLQDATANFNDLLTPAQMTGTFTATRNDNAEQQLNHAASQLVTNALGKTRLVSAAP